MSNLRRIQTGVLGMCILAELCTGGRAEEHWPGSYLHWPQHIYGHEDPCPKCFYTMEYTSLNFLPRETGHLFEVDPYGGYFFRTCNALADFVNHGLLQPDVKPMGAKHVLVALRNIPYTAGTAHDEMYGDGFVLMAPKSHPIKVEGQYQANNPPFRHPSSGFFRYEMRRKEPLRMAEPHPAFKDAPTYVTCDG